MRHIFSVMILLLAVLTMTACGSESVSTAGKAENATTGGKPTMNDGSLSLTSSAFAEGGGIPDKNTYMLSGQCSGQNISPRLIWSGAPAGTKSFAITMIDLDAKNWVHWVQYDIPADATELPEASGGPTIGTRGKNEFGETGYAGPCPPTGTHLYVITIYAVDTVLSQPAGATMPTIIDAIDGHILGKAQLKGTRTN